MNKGEYRFTAYLLSAQVLIAITGFLILMATFEFPDVLRQSSAYRLNLFIENMYVIAPTYYFLALTGLSQMVIALMFYRLFRYDSALLLLGTTFGVFCGLFQLIGFIRWPVLIPYLAEFNDLSPQIIAFVEGAFNHYAGMALGEHLGFLMQGLWTVCIGLTILKTKLFNPQLGAIGIGIGALTLLMSLEPLSHFFSLLGKLTNPVESAWYIWLIFLATSLLRSTGQQDRAPRFKLHSLGLAVLVWLSFVVPEYL